MRNQIRRGHRLCKVEKISAEWLAANGYSCYASAFQRYRQAKPGTELLYRQNILKAVGGPCEFWGVFAQDGRLAGYCRIDVEENHASTSVIKYNPDYLKQYSSYALMDSIANHYVAERGMLLNNGCRAIYHDTSVQDFLLKFGWKRKYCNLHVTYSPLLRIGIASLFPVRDLVAKLPGHGLLGKMKALLNQEMIHRTCKTEKPGAGSEVRLMKVRELSD
jgi:hypothetical protein